MKKNIILFLFNLFFILNLGLAQKERDVSNDTSVMLRNEDPAFIIKFPNQYSLKESNEDKGLKSERYESEFKGDIYMLKYSEHKNPAVSGDNRVYMDASLDSFITGIKGTLIQKNEFKYLKTNGLEAFLSIDGKNLYVFYRVLIVDRVQYQIIVITKSKEKTKETDQFFKSLIITNP
jgi:hypothetical protein